MSKRRKSRPGGKQEQNRRRRIFAHCSAASKHALCKQVRAEDKSRASLPTATAPTPPESAKPSEVIARVGDWVRVIQPGVPEHMLETGYGLQTEGKLIGYRGYGYRSRIVKIEGRFRSWQGEIRPDGKVWKRGYPYQMQKLGKDGKFHKVTAFPD